MSGNVEYLIGENDDDYNPWDLGDAVYEIGADDDEEYEIGHYELGHYEIGQYDDDDDEFEDDEDEDDLLLRALLSGDEDEEYEIGARRRRRFRSRRPLRRRRPVRRRRRMATLPRPPALGRGRMTVREKRPSSPRVLHLGFDSGANIAAGASLDVITRPQDVFSPRKLMVEPLIASNFVINDVKVGNLSQFSSGTSAVPASIFTPDSVANDVKYDTAQVSQDIVIRVTNISAGASRFRAAMIGFVARI